MDLPKNIKAVALDMDGVMRIGKQAVPGISQVLEKIKEKNLKCMILTNECRYSESKIRHDLYDMEINFNDNWSIYTSAMAAHDFLIKRLQKPNFNHQKEEEVQNYIGIVGEKGLKDSIKKIIDTLPEIPIHISNLPPLDNDNASLFLILGTVYNLDITDLEKALRWIKRGAKVIITCPDINDPELKGDFAICMPRHILHMVRLNAKVDYFSVGKPSAFMAQAIRRNLQVVPEDILYIGDTLMTDIVLAEESGMVSGLVLTGNTKLIDLEKSVIQPDFVFNNLSELADAIDGL